MSLVNATSKIRLFINREDYSDYLVEGSISDDSAYSTNIITSKGSLTLAGDPSIIDYNKTLFPIGSEVTLYATLDNGKLAKLPRGHLYVLNSEINVNNRSTTLELGCSLAYLSEREGQYVNKIESLTKLLIASATLDSFVIEEYNLSTLQNLLEVEGSVIFQDAWGHVQRLNQFGQDGLGSNIQNAKLTSFDLSSAINIEAIGGAIEEIPSAVLVEATATIPKEGEEDEGATPPPYITSVTDRIIDRPDMKMVELASGTASFLPENLPSSGEATTEYTPNCGTISNPNEPSSTTYGYTVTAKVVSITREVTEQVTQGRYISYGAAGNQVDWEYDFEYCSAMTYANSLISGVVEKYVETTNTEIEKAKGLLSKANQALQTRDNYVGRTLTYVNGVPDANSQLILNAIDYYNCLADGYIKAARDISFRGGAKWHAEAGFNFADEYQGIYGYSYINQTFNTYGDAGELIKKVQHKYVHTAQTAAAQKAINAVQPFYRLSPVLDEARFNIITGLDFSPFGDILGESYDQTIDGDSLQTEHSELIFRNPEGHLNVKLVSITTTTYKYGDLYTTETEKFEDLQDPSNNYLRTNYSSSGSKNAPEEDRIELQKDGNGCTYVNNKETETKELSYLQQVSITNQSTSSTSQISWLGVPKATTKTVSFPLEFAPIAPKNCNGTIINFDYATKLSYYKRLVAKYAQNLAKKIASDNFGFRISEHGNRAEVFEYYPFYPISLNLQSLEKGYKLRAASSNWVFDSNNVLCSFDCFNVGEIERIAGFIESPSTYSAFIKTEATTTLTNAYFNLPETANQIKIKALPTGGTLEVNGTAVSAEDLILVSDITGSNVTFTPTGSGTVDVSTLFEVLDSSNNTIDSINSIYPPLQSVYVEIAFADGGEFTNNTTNGGYDADGGEFTLGSVVGGNINLNGGDFDTGAAVATGQVQFPSGISLANGDTDPETEMGITVLDANNTSISSDTLPKPSGNVDPNFEVIVDFSVKSNVFLKLSAELIAQKGWDYNYIKLPLGTNIDMGTIVTPNAFAMDFGTIQSPSQPALASYVS
jgi:hypothetical protein